MSQQENENKPRVGISIGDINSISHELIFKTFSDTGMLQVCTPVVYGSARAWAFHRKALGFNEIQYQSAVSGGELSHKKLNLINCWDEEVKIEFGAANSFTGKYALIALNKALEDFRQGFIDVLVTCPLDKNAVSKTEPSFTGHTEYLALYFNSGTPLMIMVSEGMRLICATVHLPLRQAVSAINQDLLRNKVRQAVLSLKNDFGILKPKIAVLGLNPHAGDGGLLGAEERDIIEPAIRTLSADDQAIVLGPYPADGFFGKGLFKRFDLVMAMYHDQGLIPFKTLYPQTGVNYTAGLPIVRTSPAHGTGADIAGKNKADESSFRSAIFRAIDIYKMRAVIKEANAQPLKLTSKEADK